MSTGDLIVQFDKPQEDIHERFVDILDFFDSEQKTLWTTGDLKSIRYCWCGIPSTQLKDIARRLAVEGSRYKIPGTARGGLGIRHVRPRRGDVFTISPIRSYI